MLLAVAGAIGEIEKRIVELVHDDGKRADQGGGSQLSTMLEHGPGPGSVAEPRALHVLVNTDDVVQLRLIHGASNSGSPPQAVPDSVSSRHSQGCSVAPDFFRRGQALDVLPVPENIVSKCEHL